MERGGPIGPDEVLALIRERLAEILEIDDARITREARFDEDLSADSLALIELVESLEEELGRAHRRLQLRRRGPRRPQDACGDAVDYVVARLAAAGDGS